MKTIRNILAVCAIVGMVWLVATGSPSAHGAPVGDQTPKANYGRTCTLMDDGGTGTATPMWDAGSRLSGSNAFAIHNPTASSGTIYCGWNNTVSSTTGFPVTQGATLSIDITCPSTSTCPMLYCTTGSATVNQTTPNCTRYIQVK